MCRLTCFRKITHTKFVIWREERRHTMAILHGDIMNVSAVAFNEQFTKTHTASPSVLTTRRTSLTVHCVCACVRIYRKMKVKWRRTTALHWLTHVCNKKKCQNDFNWSEHTFNNDGDLPPQYNHFTGQFLPMQWWFATKRTESKIPTLNWSCCVELAQIFRRQRMRGKWDAIKHIIQMCEKLLNFIVQLYSHE